MKEEVKTAMNKLSKKVKEVKTSKKGREGTNKQSVINEYKNIIIRKTDNVPKIVYKQRVKRDVTILLIENSANTIKERENLLKIVNAFGARGLIYIISYGKQIKISKDFEPSNFENKTCFIDEEMSNETCLFDALVELEVLLSKRYITENPTQRIIAKDITIIGIGTCKDSCSKASKEEGIDSFCNVIKKYQAITKYFCLTDDYFLNAAEIGFASIGAISKEY